MENREKVSLTLRACDMIKSLFFKLNENARAHCYARAQQIDENVLPYLVLNSIKHVQAVPIKGSQMKDAFTLLDNPTILQYIKEKIVRWRADLHDIYQLLTVFNKLGPFILQLEAANTPSEKLREFCENDLPTILSELEDESTRGDKQ